MLLPFRRVRHVVLIAFVLVLAGCGVSGQTGTQPTPTSAIATTPAVSCDFIIDDPPPAPQGSLPYESGTGRSALRVEQWAAIAMASAGEGWAIARNTPIPHATLFIRYHDGRWVVPFGPLQQDLRSLAMVSPNEGWAVGDEGVIMHYAGGKWTVAVPAGSLPYFHHFPFVGPDYMTNYLSSVSMTSATDGWAVGQGIQKDSAGHMQEVRVFVHYTGGRWTVVEPATPGPVERPPVVSMVSAGDGWALGGGSVFRYQQGRWLEDPASTSDPAWKSVQVNGVSMASAAEGWAVGQNATSGVVARYCGGKWTIAGPANLAHADQLDGAILTGVAMVSPREGWMIGSRPGPSAELGRSGFILHYLDGRWSAASTPLVAGCALSVLAMDSASDGWVIGTCGASGPYETFLLHYHSGAWSLYQNEIALP